MLFTVNRAKRVMLPILFTAISLEREYGGDENADWLATTFLSVTVSPTYLDTLRAISKIQDRAERIKQLKRTGLPVIFGGGRGFFRSALFFIGLLQIAGSIILTSIFKWQLF